MNNDRHRSFEVYLSRDEWRRLDNYEFENEGLRFAVCRFEESDLCIIFTDLAGVVELSWALNAIPRCIHTRLARALRDDG